MEPPALVRAPAKLTRTLRITGVRPDGLHLLDAEMVSLELADELEIGPGDGLEVVDRTPLEGHGPVPTGPENLVRRGLAAVGRRAAVRLVKRIPAGAGLGGGSADAAAVLRWAGVAPDRAGLALAAALGADVPFCLTGGRARVTGIGEEVEPLPEIGLEATLLLLPFGVPTAAAYARWDELGGPTALGPNDLEPAALAVEPRLAVWRDALGDATGAAAVLAGSGSTWFVEGAWPDLVGPFRPRDWEGPAGAVVVTRNGRP
ncbi:MAG TPA: 4-(cytidine 5'-diphospho)-2-C-methyl-D-erythritol kinase [Acidimicrobiales bacterium]|nr:4-(cytidine 5'-diphospho)-2-C-methyl-D-erythritol kinase [Acidimicrobiales bacterium]